MEKNNNGKLKLVVLIGIFALIMTWFVAGGSYSDSGVYTAGSITRAGIFDFFSLLFYSFYYRMPNIMYILVVGGLYGVLSKTKAYRKLLDKTASFVKNKETIVMLITTLLIGLYTSLCGDFFVLLMFVPFIISVFLRCGKDKITALNAAVGGIFIGTVGLTLGTVGMGSLASSLSVKLTDGIGFKIALFVAAYILYNLFAILHMNNLSKEMAENDLFATESLDESKVKKNRKTKIWPTMIVMVVVIVIALLAFINWEESYSVDIFKNALEGLQNIKAGDVPFVYNILGSVTAFGEWDLVNMSAILIIATLIIGLMNGLKFDEVITEFGNGMKKISKVALIYGLVFVSFMVCYAYGWQVTVTTNILGTKFNMFRVLIAGFFIAVMCVDPEFITYILGTHLSTTFVSDLVATNLIMGAAYSLALIISPTSFWLMMILTYLDIPFKDWLKYIWKLALALLIIFVLIFSIMCFM